MGLAWANGTRTTLARRQRASLIRDPWTGLPTHLLNGADLTAHMPAGPGVCEGCHWGQGFSLVQPLRTRTAATDAATATGADDTDAMARAPLVT
jgi:hypothetical protein